MGAPDSRGRTLLFPKNLPKLPVIVGGADHERKRKIAVKCLELEEMLEKQGWVHPHLGWSPSSVINVSYQRSWYHFHFMAKSIFAVCSNYIFLTGSHSQRLRRRWLHFAPCCSDNSPLSTTTRSGVSTSTRERTRLRWRQRTTRRRRGRRRGKGLGKRIFDKD